MIEERESNRAIRALVLLALLLKIRALHRLFEHHVSARVVAQGLAGCRLVTGPKRIDPPELYRIDSEPFGDAIHVHFNRELACGAPNPRNAPFGGVFVNTVRPRMRTLSQLYGPAA